jgi:hypothetical protein
VPIRATPAVFREICDINATELFPSSARGAGVEPLLFGRRQLAQALGVSLASLARLDAAAKLPRALRLSGRKLWARETIVEWIRLGCPPRKEFELRTAQSNHQHR